MGLSPQEQPSGCGGRSRDPQMVGVRNGPYPHPPAGVGSNGKGWEGDAKGDWTDSKSSALEEWSLKKRNRQEDIGWSSGVTPLVGYRPEEASLIRMVAGRGGGTA